MKIHMVTFCAMKATVYTLELTSKNMVSTSSTTFSNMPFFLFLFFIIVMSYLVIPHNILLDPNNECLELSPVFGTVAKNKICGSCYNTYSPEYNCMSRWGKLIVRLLLKAQNWWLCKDIWLWRRMAHWLSCFLYTEISSGTQHFN